ncbi:MAG TPA: DAK2 domain-containing protein, partial [Anaerolineae bacterium]|nr:DAK2 domain-containing protein [Anaerolineae bacterium]
VLPNDKNIILAANQVKHLTDKHVQVIPSKTVPQGLSALLAFNFQADLDANVRVMTLALNRIRTVELTRAVRSAQINGVNVTQGQPIALLDGDLVASGEEMNALLLEVLHLAGAEDSEIVSVYYGSDIRPAAAEEIRARLQREFPEQEIEIHWGGQPLYPYVVSIE